MSTTREQHGQRVRARPDQEVAERPGRAAADKSTREIKAAVVRDKGGPFKVESLTLEEPRRDEVLVRIVATGHQPGRRRQ